MGDGFGVGAGIVGVVSLGLTVCQGLIKFYNSARSQQADVANAVRQLESVRSTLTVLEGVTKKTPPDSYGNVLNVESKIKLCGEGINSLSAYLKKCEPERKQKIFYPFRRESLRELGQTLQSLQQNLSTALGAFTVALVLEDRLSLRDFIASHFTNLVNRERILAQTINQRFEEFGRQLTSHGLMVDAKAFNGGLKMDDWINEAHLTSNHVPSTSSFLKSTSEIARRQPRSEMSIAESKNPVPRAFAQSSSSSVVEHSPRMELQEAFFCSCTKRWSLTSNQRFYGGILLVDTTKVHYSHDRCCPYFIGPQKKSRNIAIRISSSYLSRMIEAAFIWTRGPGGLSMSPSIRFHATVPEDAPAFTLVRSLIPSRVTRSTRPPPRNILSPEVSSTLMQLLKLFQSGKASPCDRIISGDTLLSSLTDYVWEFCLRGELDLLIELSICLVNWGCAINERRVNFPNPLEAILASSSIPSNYGVGSDTVTISSGISAIIDLGAEVGLKGFLIPGMRGNIYSSHLRSVRGLAEATGLSELCKAIVQQDRITVEKMLQNDPTRLMETSAYTQTPLHLAVDWPEGLQILLKAKNIDNILNNVDELMYESALEYACHSKNEDSLALLLAADCALSSPDYTGFMNAISRSSPHQIRQLVHGLADRRRRFQTLARSVLRQGDLLDSPSHRLVDEEASELSRRIIQQGYEVSESIRPPLQKTTVFHCYKKLNIARPMSVEAAEELFAVGFRDIEVFDHRGITPLMLSCQWGSKQDMKAYLEYAMWLISKGANLMKGKEARNVDSGDPCPTAIHHLAVSIGEAIGAAFRPYPSSDTTLLLTLTWPDQLYATVWNLLQQVFITPVSDGCNCACAPTGCTPLDLFLRTLAELEGRIDEAQYLAQVIEVLGEFCSLSPVQTTNLYRRFISLSTFYALELTHTCCKTKYDEIKSRQGDDTDALEIREEEARLIERYHTLVEEMLATFEKESIRLEKFIETIWVPAIEKERCGEDTVLDEGNVQKIAALGVTLERLEKDDRLAQAMASFWATKNAFYRVV